MSDFVQNKQNMLILWIVLHNKANYSAYFAYNLEPLLDQEH